MTNVTKTQLLSPEATKEFNEAVSIHTLIRQEDGKFHERVTFMITPAGVLKEPIRADLTTGKLFRDKEQVKTYPAQRGYLQTYLKFADGSWKNVGAHRLIHFADTFEWSSKADGTAIHHINTITDDNRAINLEMLTNSDNVLRFFDGRDNQEDIKNQQYLNDRINVGTVPLMFEGTPVEGYTINTMGEVFHKRIIKGEVVNYKQHPSVANPKYPTNLNVKFNGKTTGLAHLMAENFLEVPTGYYKTLMKDASIANPYQPQNLYTVAKKHQ